MATWDLNPIRFQVLEKGGANTSCSEATMNAVLIGVIFNEPIDFLHLDNLSFHPGNFGDARCSPPPIGKSLKWTKSLIADAIVLRMLLHSFRYQP